MIKYIMLIALICTCCSGCANLWNRLFSDEEKKIEIKEEEKKEQEELIGTMEGDEATDEDIEIEKASGIAGFLARKLAGPRSLSFYQGSHFCCDFLSECLN